MGLDYSSLSSRLTEVARKRSRWERFWDWFWGMFDFTGMLKSAREARDAAEDLLDAEARLVMRATDRDLMAEADQLLADAQRLLKDPTIGFRVVKAPSTETICEYCGMANEGAPTTCPRCGGARTKARK